jgi:hypothetical protein
VRSGAACGHSAGRSRAALYISYRAPRAPAFRARKQSEETPMLKSALLVTSGIIIGAGAINVLHAQSGAPYYLVAEINVKDKNRV